MAERKSLDELEIMSPKELGGILLLQVGENVIDVEYIKDIIDSGAYLEARDFNNWAALHYFTAHGYGDIVRLLISAGASLEVKEDYDRTPLHYAAHYGHVDTVKALLAAGAFIEAIDKRGHTSLHYSAYNGNTGAILALLDAGASKEVKDTHDQTPWDVATSYIRDMVPQLNPNYHD